jgi:hypothetical protein
MISGYVYESDIWDEGEYNAEFDYVDESQLVESANYLPVGAFSCSGVQVAER